MAVDGFSRRSAAAHETDGQKLVQLGQRAQHRDARIEMRAGTELDEFLPVFHPVRYRHKARNPEIAGDVEHPKPASGFGKLGFADRGCRNRRTGRGPLPAAAIDCTTRLRMHPVPPARGIPGRSLPRACCRPRSRWNPRGPGSRGRPLVEKIQQAGRKIFEAFVAQRPDRRPFDLGRSIEWTAAIGVTS